MGNLSSIREVLQYQIVLEENIKKSLILQRKLLPTIVIYDLLYNACVQISTSRLSHIDPIPWTLDQILYRIYFTAYNSEFSLGEALLEVFVLL